MAEANWGRKETIIWPPRKPIYTFGAGFLAVVAAVFFVYIHFAFALSPLERFYLPLYIRTSIAPTIHSSGKYQMLLTSDGRAHAWYAKEEDVVPGSTPQADSKVLPLALSDSARQRGILYLYRSAPSLYQTNLLGSYLKQQVYAGESIFDLFRWPLIFGAVALLVQLPLSIPKDIRRFKSLNMAPPQRASSGNTKAVQQSHSRNRHRLEGRSMQRVAACAIAGRGPAFRDHRRHRQRQDNHHHADAAPDSGARPLRHSV